MPSVFSKQTYHLKKKGDYYQRLLIICSQGIMCNIH